MTLLVHGIDTLVGRVASRGTEGRHPRQFLLSCYLHSSSPLVPIQSAGDHPTPTLPPGSRDFIPPSWLAWQERLGKAFWGGTSHRRAFPVWLCPLVAPHLGHWMLRIQAPGCMRSRARCARTRALEALSSPYFTFSPLGVVGRPSRTNTGATGGLARGEVGGHWRVPVVLRSDLEATPIWDSSGLPAFSDVSGNGSSWRAC